MIAKALFGFRRPISSILSPSVRPHVIIIIIGIQPLGRFGQRPELS